jgi:3-isopropylmalate dehydrogenase
VNNPLTAPPTHRDDIQLTASLPGWANNHTPNPKAFIIGILNGEGIGPEIMSASVEVLKAIQRASPYQFEIRYGGLIGNQAQKAFGRALTPEIIAWVESIFSDGGTLLCGPAGSRFVYDLREKFDFFCKLTPVRPYSALSDTGVLRPEARDNVDMIVVRENTGGMYFGKWSRKTNEIGQDKAQHAFSYCADEVRRILDVGIKLAKRRRGRLSLVVKPDGIPGISKLWTDIFRELIQGTNLTTSVLEVDNASYQIVAAAQEFDVIVASNLFGDILADNAALLLGSRGLSYSGNFAANGRAAYQTGHGAAHNIAGKGIANPIGQIMSTAFMLRESFNLFTATAAIEKAIGQTLASGIRTPDISTPGSTVVGTEEISHRIAKAVETVLGLREHSNPLHNCHPQIVEKNS